MPIRAGVHDELALALAERAAASELRQNMPDPLDQFNPTWPRHGSGRPVKTGLLATVEQYVADTVGAWWHQTGGDPALARFSFLGTDLSQPFPRINFHEAVFGTAGPAWGWPRYATQDGPGSPVQTEWWLDKMTALNHLFLCSTTTFGAPNPPIEIFNEYWWAEELDYVEGDPILCNELLEALAFYGTSPPPSEFGPGLGLGEGSQNVRFAYHVGWDGQAVRPFYRRAQQRVRTPSENFRRVVPHIDPAWEPVHYQLSGSHVYSIGRVHAGRHASHNSPFEFPSARDLPFEVRVANSPSWPATLAGWHSSGIVTVSDAAAPGLVWTTLSSRYVALGDTALGFASGDSILTWTLAPFLDPTEAGICPILQTDWADFFGHSILAGERHQVSSTTILEYDFRMLEKPG